MEEISKGVLQMFVSDEKSAVIWLHAFLEAPKTYSDISPAFNKVAFISDDDVPELIELLDQNFIVERDKYRRPMSEDEKQTQQQKRDKALSHEFEELLLEAKNSKKKIKNCRKQAVVYGFEQFYRKNRFEDILTLAKKLDKKILENSSEITEFIEIAEVKVEGF
ncbi:MAG: hypothetical protein HQM13_18960 [SAR324 cluster bacterium]|nr:hypothetical protein [SAR324 cluster bacterium]